MKYIVLGLLMVFLLGGPAGAQEPAGEAPGEVPEEEREPLSHWLEMLGHADQEKREHAEAMLSERGKALFSGLTETMEDPRARLHAIGALSEIASEVHDALPALAEHLDEKETAFAAAWAMVRLNAFAMRRLEELDGQDEQSVQAAARMLAQVVREQEHKMEKGYGALVLATLGRPAVDPLLAMMEEDDPDLRYAAVYALGWMGEAGMPEAAEPAVPRLIEVMKSDPSDQIRNQAAQTLGQLAPVSKEAVPAMIELLKKDSPIRVRIGHSLTAFGPGIIDELMPFLQELPEEPPRGGTPLRKRVIFIIGQMGDPAVPRLVEMLHDQSKAVSSAAAEALSHASMYGESERAVEELIDALDDAQPRVRRLAAGALRGIWPRFAQAAVGPLVEAMDDPERGVRLEAADALAAIAPDRAAEAIDVPRMLPGLVEDVSKPEQDVRERAARVLKVLGPKAKAAAPRLVEIYHTSDEYDVRTTVRRVLKEIDPAAAERLEED